jgi:hypothetical protein
VLQTLSAHIASVVAPVAVSAIGWFVSRTLIAWEEAKKNRSLADAAAFESALASADLDTLAAMLRDRFGSVSIEALLDDPTTQDNVFKSLKRLTEVINQPTTDTAVEEPEANSDLSLEETVAATHPPASGSPTATYVDRLDGVVRAQLGAKIVEIAEAAERRVHGTDMWNALAAARRELEQTILPQFPSSRKYLSPRLFFDPKLRTAMGAFLAIANRAIHGEQISLEHAERAANALRFVGIRLAAVTPDDD